MVVQRQESHRTMEVSPATDADVPALCELLGLLFAQESEFHPAVDRQAAGLRTILGHPDAGKVLVLRDGPLVVGMGTLLFLPSTALGGRVALLEDMVVKPVARGAGGGGRLLRAAIDYARSAGCLRITLLTDAHNVAAQRFYGRHGFARSAMIPMRLLLGGQRQAEPSDAADPR